MAWRLAAVAGGLACWLGACADFERGDPSPITADAGATDASTETSAETAGEAGASSYARDVHPLIVAGCRRCHVEGGQAGHTTFLLSGQAETDYPRARMLVKPGDAAGSRLLSKAAGSGHGGGSIYGVGSPEYQRISQWIEEGALP